MPASDDVRIAALVESMSLEEKLAQLVSLRLGPSDGTELVIRQCLNPGEKAPSFEALTARGLGQLTQPMGTAPTDPAAAVRTLTRVQRLLAERTPHGIPALVHEECLTGAQVFGATTYPCPLAWGASWHPELVEQMAAAIGAQLRGLGVHLGLAPVLDVVCDPRWGRVEECIAEDPYMVGVIGTAYVRGLQSAGVGATLKHFVGHSASRAGRNTAPVSIGQRELAETHMLPFEMVVRTAGPRAVMHSYAAVDGIPPASDDRLLRDLLRRRWGFNGIVVSDYHGVERLQTAQRVAADLREAAVLALQGGVDIELPAGLAYRSPLAEAVRAGDVPERLVDEAVRRMLAQKQQLGVCDLPPDTAPSALDLDPPEYREIAQRLAEESVILLANDRGLLPLHGAHRVAVVGPNADRPQAMLGGYSFTNQDGLPPDTPLGIQIPTVLQSIRQELGSGVTVTYSAGCDVRGEDRSEFDDVVDLAAAADVCVAVVGDQAGRFGRGTVGEGCDTDDLDLPGVQRELVERLLAVGTPVVLVLVTGRPRAIGWAGRAAAIVQAFFPGEMGGPAIAGVLSGRVNPSGRLAVSIPRSAGAQPYTYLHPWPGGQHWASTLDPTPAFPFGHGLSFTTFSHHDLTVTPDRCPVDGIIEVACTVTNDGPRAGVDIVQLYARDVVASVPRPLRQLTGWSRVPLEPGATARVTFRVPTDRLGFVGRDLERIVEPGEIEFIVAPSAAAAGHSKTVELTGEVRTVPDDREFVTGVQVERA
jgi:beta-glucosidase